MAVKRQFNQASAYEQDKAEHDKFGVRLTDLLVPQKGSKVLDLGCGTGNQSLILSDHVGPDGQVLAIDPDVERLEIARRKHGAPNLTYSEGSASEIPGTEYDFVFCNYVLHWVKDKDLVFRQVSRALKKGGKFAFTSNLSSETVDSVSEDTHSKAFVDSIKDTMHFTSPEEFSQLATSNSFSVDCWKQFSDVYVYRDANELKEAHLKQFNLVDFDATTHIDAEALAKKFGNGKIEMELKSLRFLLTKL